jgi:hypothetical protein
MSGILKTKEHNVSGTGSVSVLRRGKRYKPRNSELEKGLEGSAVIAYSCHYSGICMEWLRKNMKNLSQDSKCPERD